MKSCVFSNVKKIAMQWYAQCGMVFLFAFASITVCSQTVVTPKPFPGCVAGAFQVVDVPSKFQQVNLATGQTTTLFTLPIYLNSLGFNVIDNRIYSVKLDLITNNGLNTLVAIGSDNTYQEFPITGYDIAANNLQIVVGDINSKGMLYVKSKLDLVSINCDPNSSDFAKATKVLTFPSGAQNSGVYGFDWAFKPGDDSTLYSIKDGNLLSIDVKKGEVKPKTIALSSGTIGTDYGAVYFDVLGNFYGKRNIDGAIFKITGVGTDSPTAQLFASSSASSSNDGARCPNAPAPIVADFGDAPNTYNTVTGNNGPSHIISYQNPGPAVQALSIGATNATTADTDGQPSTAANADADDGATPATITTTPALTQTIASYSVTVSVNNNTASTAYLYGWIDWNNNGSFDVDERVSATINAGSGAVTRTLTWNNVTLTSPKAGITGTYARFRLSTDNAIVQNPGGAAPNGEVEDYFIPFSQPLPVSFDAISPIITNGQLQVKWNTLTETNNDHFIIEISKDGKIFAQLAEVKSKAVDGNSNTLLTYSYTTPLGAATGIVGLLAFLGIGLAGFSTKKKLLLATTILAVIAFTYSCSKKDMPAADAQQKIWVRIAQVDKDGTTKYSKAVEAVRE